MPLIDLADQKRKQIDLLEMLTEYIEKDSLSAVTVLAKTIDGGWTVLRLNGNISHFEVAGVLERTKMKILSEIIDSDKQSEIE